MQLHQLTIPLLVSWLLLLVLAGSFGGFGIPGWALLGVLGSFPLILARQIGRGPAPTMSESIRAARR
jgi:hypothetical protein